jgi:hypothetical protein
MGDAENLATIALEAAELKVKSQEKKLLAARRERWERQIRRRFRLLVIRTINAEATNRMRHDGESPDPQLLWMELTQDSATGWNNADRFRQYLGLDLVEILPRGGPGVDDRAGRELARVRATTGRELVELIREWMAVRIPERSQ